MPVTSLTNPIRVPCRVSSLYFSLYVGGPRSGPDPKGLLVSLVGSGASTKLGR